MHYVVKFHHLLDVEVNRFRIRNMSSSMEVGKHLFSRVNMEPPVVCSLCTDKEPHNGHLLQKVDPLSEQGALHTMLSVGQCQFHPNRLVIGAEFL